MKDTLVLNILLKYSIQNAKDCLINTRELTRTTSIGETHRHRSKYAHNLKIKHISLMSNIQLLLLIESSKQTAIFNDKKSKKLLDDILNNWQKINVNLQPYQNIKQDLCTLVGQIK